MKHFRTLTLRRSGAAGENAVQNAVLMGRKTWESIPLKFRPLEGRLNVVLTRSPSFVLPAGVERSGSLDDAMKLLATLPIDRCFVIGGASLYEQAIDHPCCDLLYLTQIDAAFDCDVFFPPFEEKFELVEASPVKSEGGIHFSFKEYKRKW